MSIDDTGSSGKDPSPREEAGVLGNLPRTRPSVRSPRRTAGAPSKASGPTTAAGDATAPKATPSRSGSDDPLAPRDGESAPGADLEALARGGITLAGEAASLGLRVAGRAAAALRGAVERR